MNITYNITWAYIAGFIDCDGWVTFSKKYVIGLTQSNLFKWEMNLISDYLTKNGISNSLTERSSESMIRGNKSTTKMLNITVSAQQSLVLLCREILPFSLIKKEKINNCLMWCENRLQQRGYDIYVIKKQEKRRYWSNSEINKLHEQQSLNYSYKRIANELNRSVNSVTHKIKRNKYKLP